MGLEYLTNFLEFKAINTKIRNKHELFYRKLVNMSQTIRS